ncbi:MAG: Cof-type HAD-IIB family hydrolase [Clostridia bacterium]
MIKLIAADFDNTLCDSNKVVTERTREAIKKFQNQGGLFVIATTRPYYAIDQIARDIGLKYVIASQGASIRSVADNKYLYKNFLTREDSKEILTFIDKRICRQVLLFSDKEIHLIRKDIFYDKFHSEMPESTAIINKNLLENSKDMDIAQIMVGSIFEKYLIRRMKKWRKIYNDKFDIGLCDRHLLNFVKKDVSKGKAIQIVAKKFDIKKEEIISFGDSENDKSMFDYSGVGVAMGNAMKILKDKADAICEDCNNDGLAKYIENYVLK